MKLIYNLFLVLVMSLPALSHSQNLCSMMLSKVKIHRFKSGRNKDRLMAYKVDKPLKWNGKTIVFNQGLTRNMYYWDQHTRHFLDKGFQILRYDAFNIGQSLALNDILRVDQGYSFEDNSYAVVEILKAEGVKSDIYVVGHSLGAARAIYLSQRLGADDEYEGNPVLKLLVASPFISYLEKHYIEESTESISSLFKIPNFWPSESLLASSIDSYNASINFFFGTGISIFSMLSSSTAMDRLIEDGLKDRSALEQLGLDLSVEKEGLFQIMESIKLIDVTKVIPFLNVNIQLLTGSREGLLVPDSLLEKLKEVTPNGMSHTVIDSGHMTPEKPEFYEWLEKHFDN